MIRLLIFMTATTALMTLLILSLTEAPILNEFAKPSEFSTDLPLTILCTPGCREVVEAVVEDSLKASEDRIEVYNGSPQSLLARLELSGAGDLALLADEGLLKEAARQQLITEFEPVARMRVVLVLAAGNPLKLETLQDVKRDGVRLVLPSPELTAAGRLVQEVLVPGGKWEMLEESSQGFVSTAREAAYRVSMGIADAAVAYDTIVQGNPDLMILPVKEFENLYVNLGIGLASYNVNHERAGNFLRFLTAPEYGLRRFGEFGFSPPEGVSWGPHSIP